MPTKIELLKKIKVGIVGEIPVPVEEILELTGFTFKSRS